MASRQPLVAASAGDVGAARHLHVAEVAGRPLRAALQLATGDQAGADAGGDLDEHEVLHVGQMSMLLAQRHDVDVVVDEDGHGKGLLDVPGHVVAVPAGHDRRIDRASGGVLHRTGQAETDGGELGDGALLLPHELADRVLSPPENLLGTGRDIEVGASLGQHDAGEVGQGDAGVTRSDVDPGHDVGRQVQGKE